MKEIQLTRIRRESSSAYGNELQQGGLTVSFIEKAKKKTIRWHQQQAFLRRN